MPKVVRNILRTFSGKIVDLQKPEIFSICIEDIAQGLSNMYRFSGQSSHTVLLHSLGAAYKARSRGYDARRQLMCLLHDAAEAYIGDMPSPVKMLCPDYVKIEERLLKAIFKRFNLPATGKLPAWLKAIDDQLLEEERKFVWKPEFEEMAPPDRQVLKKRFISYFRNLQKEIYELNA